MTIVIYAAAPGLASAHLSQDSPATPATENLQISRAFDFYPAETGWGTNFEATVEAGSSVDLTVLLGNTGNVTQQLRTYGMNVFTAEGGGLGFDDDRSDPNEVTQWLEFPNDVFSVEVGEGVEITFTIAVPNDTLPGEYVTAVAAEHAEASSIEGSDQFTQKLRYVIPIYITVPGEATAHLDIGEISFSAGSDQLVLSIEISNTGDIHLQPEGELKILDANGELLASLPLSMGTVYAHDSTVLARRLDGLPPADSYQVNVELVDTDTGVSTTTESTDLVVEAPATPAPPPPITIDSASVTPSPSADDVQFANVEATISNTSEPIEAQLSLLAFRNGEEVERFPISQSLSLQTGETPVTTRYIPATGWTPGEWTFELLLETVDPQSGAAVVIESQPIDDIITIP